MIRGSGSQPLNYANIEHPPSAECTCNRVGNKECFHCLASRGCELSTLIHVNSNKLFEASILISLSITYELSIQGEIVYCSESID